VADKEKKMKREHPEIAVIVSVGPEILSFDIEYY
jgi:hypothetical protein